MRITEEQIKKLDQLNRIEYRIRLSDLERNEPESTALNFFWKMIAVCGFLFLIATMFTLTKHIESSINLFNVLTLIMKITLIFTFILWIIDILLSYNYILKRKKLNREYFKINVKPLKNDRRKTNRSSKTR